MDDFKLVELDKIVKINARDARRYVGAVRRYWCPFAQTKGKCDKMCAANMFCATHIRTAITEIVNADDPVAVFVYRIRRQKARISEQMAAAEHEPIEKNRLGETVTGDVFTRIGAGVGGR